MPDLAKKLHLGRVQWVVLGEFQLSGENAAFKGGAFGSLNESFPKEQVILIDWPRCDAIRRRGRKGAVLVKEALLRYARTHD